VRLALPRDGATIRDIYNAEVAGSQLNFDIIQWTVADQEAWLARHQGAHPAVVAVDDGDEVLGFGSLSRYRRRPAYATTVEDSVYVDRRQRSAGVGRRILDELLRLAADHGFHTVIARVAGHNEASIALHRSCGFEVVGVEKEVGRKHGQWLDVVELQRML
jgi:L-amino acid N-acyltransferase